MDLPPEHPPADAPDASTPQEPPLDDSAHTVTPAFDPASTPEQHRPSTSYSDTAYQYPQPNASRFTPSDQDTPPRHAYYDSPRDSNANGHSHSRPSSQMGRYPTSDSGNRPYSDQHPRAQQQQQQDQAPKNASVVIKVGMVGDAQIGKTSLMVKYVEGSWDEDYIQTLGVNFMEKTISIRNTEITFSIWDLGGQREFVNMLPLVCNDAVAILFMFDLTRKSTLNSIKEWYRQGRGFNKTAIPFLVGTKYDHFVNFPREEQEEISNQVCVPAPAVVVAWLTPSRLSALRGR